MTTERDIAYENSTHWVLRKPDGFEVYRKDVTHSVRCARIGFKGDTGLTRAIQEADRRHAAVAEIPKVNETKRRLLLSKWRCQLDDLRDKVEQLEEQISEHDADTEHMESALVAVRYWLHDGLVLKQPIRDPRAILRIVEDAIQ